MFRREVPYAGLTLSHTNSTHYALLSGINQKVSPMNFQHRSLSVLSALLILWLPAGAAAAASFMDRMQGGKTAVVVMALNPAAEPFKKNALSRMENILLDNAVEVLDRDKAEELKDVFKTLEDPGAFVTAETFVENAEKFDIQGLVAVYLSVGITPGLAGYFSATAQADIRTISEQNATVEALTTFPMGAPGRPPSDGLTKNSAAINAVQRAIDDACAGLGLELLDPATPRSVMLSLKGPVPVPASLVVESTSQSQPELSRLAVLENRKWRGEEITCTAKAPAGGLGAVGGYIIDTDFRRRPQRLYGSRIHLIDLQAQMEISTFECHPVEKKPSREKGTKAILHCMFVRNWRYLSALTGNTIFLWDTERGNLQSAVPLDSPLEKAELSLGQAGDASFLVIQSGGKRIAYQIVRN